MQAKGIVNTTVFARGICKNGDSVKWQGSRTATSREQVPEDRQQSALFRPSPCTMHPICTLLIIFRSWKSRCTIHCSLADRIAIASLQFHVRMILIHLLGFLGCQKRGNSLNLGFVRICLNLLVLVRIFLCFGSPSSEPQTCGPLCAVVCVSRNPFITHHFTEPWGMN